MDTQLKIYKKDIKIAEEQYNQRFTKEQIQKLEEYDLRHGFLGLNSIENNDLFHKSVSF